MSTASIGTKRRQRRQPKQEQQQQEQLQQQQQQQIHTQSSPSRYNETPRVAGGGFPYPAANVNGGAGTQSYSHLQERKASAASYVPTSGNPSDAERTQQPQQYHGQQPPVYHQYPPQPTYLSQDIFHPNQQQQQQQQQPQPPRPGPVGPPGPQPYPGQDPSYQPGPGPNAGPQRQGQPPQQWGPYPPNPNQQFYPPQPPLSQVNDDKATGEKKKPGRKPRAKKDTTLQQSPYNPQASGNNVAPPPPIPHHAANSIPLPYQQSPPNPATATAPSRAQGPKQVTRRSRLGCLTCRQRKKRCCETRPKCTECSRLGLNCVWPKPGTEHKNKPKDQKEDENTIEHEIYGRIKVLRGIVEYRSQ